MWRARRTTGAPTPLTSRRNTIQKKSGMIKTASRCIRIRIITSAATPNFMARHCFACGQKILASCSITAAFHPLGRFLMMKWNRIIPKPSSSIKCMASAASIRPSRMPPRPIRIRKSATSRAFRNCTTILRSLVTNPSTCRSGSCSTRRIGCIAAAFAAIPATAIPVWFMQNLTRRWFALIPRSKTQTSRY
ncbi:MAG: hypothetical protein ALAOOOJD_04414 [bacterium]|nr:hypothetical protein [bacterium]